MSVRSAGLLVWSAGLLAAGCWSGLFTIGDQGGRSPNYSGALVALVFHVFFGLVLKPSAMHLWSQIGAKLVPKRPQKQLFLRHF